MSDATDTDGAFSAIVQRESGLKRTLSARKLSMIAIDGAIGTGLFLGSGFAIGTAGPSVLVSYAIGALIALGGVISKADRPILVAALSAMNSQLYIITRMMFSLSRAGQAPRFLGKLTARGTPVNALLVSTSGIALATVLSVVLFGRRLSDDGRNLGIRRDVHVDDDFRDAFFFRRARRREGRVPAAFRMWGCPGTTLLGAGLMAALLLTTAFTEAFRMTLVFGLPYLACLVIIYWLQRTRCNRAVG